MVIHAPRVRPPAGLAPGSCLSIGAHRAGAAQRTGCAATTSPTSAQGYRPKLRLQAGFGGGAIVLCSSRATHLASAARCSRRGVHRYSNTVILAAIVAAFWFGQAIHPIASAYLNTLDPHELGF